MSLPLERTNQKRGINLELFSIIFCSDQDKITQVIGQLLFNVTNENNIKRRSEICLKLAYRKRRIQGF